MKTCTIDDCARPHRARGLCSTHYNRTFGHDIMTCRREGRANEDRELKRLADRHRSSRRRATARGVDAEQIDRDVLGERDRWRCHICRKHVDRTLPWPNAKSASIDHIVPLHEHGPHTYANTKIAHLRCNIRRGAQGGGEQLALIG